MLIICDSLKQLERRSNIDGKWSLAETYITFRLKIHLMHTRAREAQWHGAELEKLHVITFLRGAAVRWLSAIKIGRAVAGRNIGYLAISWPIPLPHRNNSNNSDTSMIMPGIMTTTQRLSTEDLSLRS